MQSCGDDVGVGRMVDVRPRWRARRRALAAFAVGLLAATGTTATAADAVDAPAISVTPNRALKDLQTVQVDGTGFAPGSPIAAFQCQVGGTARKGCDFASLTFGVTDAQGAVHFSTPVRRLISVRRKRVDCATAGACEIRAESLGGIEAAVAPITFDASVPPIVPKVTVTPGTGLADHQLVRLDGSGFTPGASALVLECATKRARRYAGACAYGTNRSAVIDANGKFRIRNFALSRLLPTFSDSPDGNETLDCAAKAGTCSVMVEAEDLGGPATLTPLSFDPTIPAVTPLATVTPATGLVDHQTVTVIGRGFTPGAPVRVFECSGPGIDGFGGCDYSSATAVTAGFRGQFRLDVPVQRLLAVSFGVTSEGRLDCATSPRACVLVVSDLSATEPAPLRLSFNPQVPPQQASAAVQPARGLVDNQRIAVTGTGFTPFATVALVQCSADALEGELAACDTASVQNAVAGANGRVTGSIAVHRTIGGYDGLVDCGKSNGACVIAAVAGGLSVGGYDPGFLGLLGPLGPSGGLSSSSTAAAPSPIRRAAAGQDLPGVAFAPISFG